VATPWFFPVKSLGLNRQVARNVWSKEGFEQDKGLSPKKGATTWMCVVGPLLV